MVTFLPCFFWDTQINVKKAVPWYKCDTTESINKFTNRSTVNVRCAVAYTEVQLIIYNIISHKKLVEKTALYCIPYSGHALILT